MWPLILNFARTYSVYITFPVAVIVGAVGYNMESLIRNGKEQKFKKQSIHEEREDREWKDMQDKDIANVVPLKTKVDIPKTILSRNDHMY